MIQEYNVKSVIIHVLNASILATNIHVPSVPQKQIHLERAVLRISILLTLDNVNALLVISKQEFKFVLSANIFV